MRAMYDADIDFLEVMEEGHKSVGHHVSDALTIFVSERTLKPVGFVLEGATENFRELEDVPRNMRLAGLVRLVRGLLNCTQEELAEMMGIGFRSVQRMEAGEGNPTLNSIQSLVDVAPGEIDFSILLIHQKKVGPDGKRF